MNRSALFITSSVAALSLLGPTPSHGFDSGSTGADGAFNPTVSVEVPLPPSGVFNFTAVNIPTGVTVTFRRNAANTPVVLLVQGDVIVDGTIDVRGKAAAPSGPGGSDGGDLTNDGLPGEGGPGGFAGGHAWLPGSSASKAADGMGPGGGGGQAAGGGAYASGGGYSTIGSGPMPGKVYGTPLLRPLIGGSGGGGASSQYFNGLWFLGQGGGGGGGAILVAASGTIHIKGEVLADGGSSRSQSYAVWGGGGGSGGAIRLVATRIDGGGMVTASGGLGYSGYNGGAGRIRAEADVLAGLVFAPSFTQGPPTDIFVPGLPGLSITSVGGIPVPANPVGVGDVILPAVTPDPVAITVHTNGVPPGTIISISLYSEHGNRTSTDSPPTAGTQADASATVNVSIPDGRSVLMATTSFIVTAALGEQLAPYAQGETVEQVRLIAEAGQPSRMVLLTASGRELDLPAGALAQGW